MSTEQSSHKKQLIDYNKATLYQCSQSIVGQSKNKESLTALNTGFTNINEKLGGLHLGKLYVLGGAYAMGKELLLDQLALNVADDSGVLYLPFSESVDRLINRLMGIVADIPPHFLEQLPWDQKKLNRIEEKINAFKTKNCYIEKVLRYDEDELLKLIETYICEKEIRLVIIDDEKCLFHGIKKTRTPHEKHHFVLKLKMLFQNLGCSGIILKKIAPATPKKKNPYRLPRSKDLRTDYALLELTDEIWMMHRLEYYGMVKDEDNKSTASRIDLYQMYKGDGHILQALYFKFKSGATAMEVLEEPDDYRTKGLL